MLLLKPLPPVVLHGISVLHNWMALLNSIIGWQILNVSGVPCSFTPEKEFLQVSVYLSKNRLEKRKNLGKNF